MSAGCLGQVQVLSCCGKKELASCQALQHSGEVFLVMNRLGNALLSYLFLLR
jgi:hypothetical protein